MPRKKTAAEKRVAVLFSLSPKIKDELDKKIPAGYRSQFVEKLVEREFAKAAMKTTNKKNFLSRLFKK
ncbi:MAG: hypothetical protein K9L85_02130 [Candidatus Peribacteraceae bacterium]|nr:hypothetical protein [Candidatus Peribacteraceae bacterium]